jgi:hypothetical protein
VAEGRACQHREDMNLMEYISMKKIQQTFDKAQDAYQKLVRSAKRKKNKKRKIVEWKPHEPTGTSVGTLAYNLVAMYKSKVVWLVAHAHNCSKQDSLCVTSAKKFNHTILQFQFIVRHPKAKKRSVT